VASTTFVEALTQRASKEFKKIGIIYDDNAFGQADRDFALEDLKALNIGPVAVVPIPDVGREYTPQLTQFQKAGADVLIAPISGTNASQLRKDMVRIGYEPLILGPNSLAFQSMIDVGKEFVEEKVQFLDLIDETKPAVQDFQKKMQAAYQKPATSGFELLGYDAMMILAHALKQGGGDKSKVRDTLENLQGYEAVSGKAGSTISYSAQDHRRASPADLVWRKVKGGKFTNVN
jgi:branched-chain amino acid transport system substrate-binding protein